MSIRCRAFLRVAASGVVAAVLLVAPLPTSAFQVCAKEDPANPGFPRERSKLFLKTTCDPARREVAVGLEVTGTVGSDAVVKVSGANLQVVSGAGTTTSTPNGLGNVIVGYNENSGPGVQSGSHNLVLGIEQSYPSYGGLIAGSHNTIGAPFASVPGGTFNVASGDYAVVGGGIFNQALGNFAAVSGGALNTASGEGASVTGGVCNLASGGSSTVIGGQSNVAGLEAPSTAGCVAASTAPAFAATVSGGQYNQASGANAGVGGGTNNHASGGGAIVAGGDSNSAVGQSSAVGGGQNRSAAGSEDWQAGSLFEDF